jgi:cobalt-zinc-cadmium efflux system protein
VLNSALVAAQVVFGIAAHSMALLADAAHNFGDVLALVLAWGAALLGRRAPSLQRTYGWGRSSILAALINAIVLLISVGAIGVEAVKRFLEPMPVAGITVMWVAAIGIVVNGFTAWLFSRGHEDINIRAAFLHTAADAAVSLGVVVAAASIQATGWLWVDPVTSLLIVAVIVVGTWGVLRDSVNLAMDGVPGGIAASEVEGCLRSLPGVIEVHDLHIWGLSTTETALTAHLVRGETGAETDTVEDLVLRASHEVRERFGIGHATLQVETENLAAACRLRPAHVV